MLINIFVHVHIDEGCFETAINSDCSYHYLGLKTSLLIHCEKGVPELYQTKLSIFYFDFLKEERCILYSIILLSYFSALFQFRIRMVLFSLGHTYTGYV